MLDRLDKLAIVDILSSNVCIVGTGDAVGWSGKSGHQYKVQNKHKASSAHLPCWQGAPCP